jgi:hypothetical protein
VTKRKAITEEELPDDIGMLDDLIKKLYKKLSETVDKQGKIGDLLKMIEVRRKLAPQESAQRAFWEMMNRIREGTMPEAKGSSAERSGKSEGAPAHTTRRAPARKGAR